MSGQLLKYSASTRVSTVPSHLSGTGSSLSKTCLPWAAAGNGSSTASRYQTLLIGGSLNSPLSKRFTPIQSRASRVLFGSAKLSARQKASSPAVRYLLNMCRLQRGSVATASHPTRKRRECGQSSYSPTSPTASVARRIMTGQKHSSLQRFTPMTVSNVHGGGFQKGVMQ